MKKRTVVSVIGLCLLAAFSGCAKKADPNRSIDQITQEVQSMTVEQLEAQALAYANAIQEQRLKIQKIQEKIRKMPMEKVFSNNFLQNDIKKIGHTAEALFDRYVIYVNALQEKGGDISKVQLKTV